MSAPLTIGTWNVNGIRARLDQVQEWVTRERPDVLCLQEIKASPDQIPMFLLELEDYWTYWHGAKGYSGVGLLVRKTFSTERPAFEHPAFDYEHRIVTVRTTAATVASVYVPNGGKDFPAKMQFLAALDQFAADHVADQVPLVICGDLNVARTDRDVHPKERKPRAIGQLPEERAILERMISHGLVDVGRAVDPDNDDLFTWWAPWREMRQRNIGWRLDYVLASQPLYERVRRCESQREFGTSDHAPVIAVFEGEDSREERANGSHTEKRSELRRNGDSWLFRGAWAGRPRVARSDQEERSRSQAQFDHSGL